MGPLLAIVGDTWRQSRQQVVFIIMLILLAVVVICGIALPTEKTSPQGGPAFDLVIGEGGGEGLEMVWLNAYATAHAPEFDTTERWEEDVAEKKEKSGNDSEQPKSFTERHRERIESLYPSAKATSRFDRAAQVWMMGIMTALLWVAMPMFIGACAGYFPELLAAGAVDVVLAKPIRRHEVFFGKYFGGLLLFSVAVLGATLLLFLGTGLRFGLWHFRIFAAIPLTIFSGAVLYALLALLGVKSRSTALAMIVGFIFYYVVDTIIGVFQSLQIGGQFDTPWLNDTVEASRYVLPNFSMINATTTSSVLNVPNMDWTPIVVGAGWMAISLALGCWIFRRRDF